MDLRPSILSLLVSFLAGVIAAAAGPDPTGVGENAPSPQGQRRRACQNLLGPALNTARELGLGRLERRARTLLSAVAAPLSR
jgi:hypothetical protein